MKSFPLVQTQSEEEGEVPETHKKVQPKPL